MSTRRVLIRAGEAWFDYGAQYFTVRDTALRRPVLDGGDPADVAIAVVATPAEQAPVDQAPGLPASAAPDRAAHAASAPSASWWSAMFAERIVASVAMAGA